MSEAVGDDCDHHHDYDRRNNNDYRHCEDDDNDINNDNRPRASTHGDAVARRARRIGAFALSMAVVWAYSRHRGSLSRRWPHHWEGQQGRKCPGNSGTMMTMMMMTTAVAALGILRQ